MACEAKRTFEDCALIITGDFNQWPIHEVMEDHPDLREIDFGPTRGSRSIDRTLTNFNRSVVETSQLPPLETESGLVSDHNMTFARASFPRTRAGNITFSYRPFSEAAAAAFVSAVSVHDWTGVLANADVESEVSAFQEVLDHYMDKFFPLKTTTRRESDPPWVNDALRRLSKKRRRVYDKEGRSARWKKLTKKSKKMYRQRAENYINTQKEKLTARDAEKNFYKNIKAYKSREKPPNFNPCNLYPDASEGEVAEKLADHFNAVSKEFDGIEPDQIPDSFSAPVHLLGVQEVADRLVAFRKPKSMVSGDIFPQLVSRAAPWLAIPLTDIYNKISSGQSWPSDWKKEYVTPIPKKAHPEGPNDLRNISCTKLFSKIYESFVLSWLTGQASLRPNQYGGVKGLGTEHFLLNLWQNVLESLDDQRSASLLTSIDYSKAFNRLDFVCCLKALKAKGVSKELLNIVASFLSGRSMTVKVGSVNSQPKTVEGGVPQGSLLGVFLFNVTIDCFEAFSRDIEPYGPRPVDILGPIDEAAYPPEAEVLQPILARDYLHLAPFRETLLQVQKYVDDNIIHERMNFDKIATDGYGVRSFLAARTQNAFNHIGVRAEHCKMKVNSAKTNALLISELKAYTPEAFFFDKNGEKISTKESMRVLGFHFSSRPDMSEQVGEIRRKFVSRMWILRHLGHRGFNSSDLTKVYKSIILPVHDYCSVVYHSSLTNFQSEKLERLQAQALKCIYGYQYSYRELLELTGLQTLRERREARCLKFALKSVANPNLAGWFPLNNNPRQLRHVNRYQEFGAKTTRLQRSPLYDLRRRLNRLVR